MPNYAGGYVWRADVYLAQHNFDAAISDCGRALALDPKYVPALASRANAYAAQGDLAKAVADCDEAVESSRTRSWPM